MVKTNFSRLILEKFLDYLPDFFSQKKKNLSKTVILHIKFKANLFNTDNIVNH